MSPRVLFASEQTNQTDSCMLSAFEPLRGTCTYTGKIVRCTNCRPPDFLACPVAGLNVGSRSIKRINHRCIPGDTIVSSVASTTVTLSHATSCATSGAETVYFTGTGIGPDNTIIGINDTNVTLA